MADPALTIAIVFACAIMLVLITVIAHAEAMRLASALFERMKRAREVRLASSIIILVFAHILEAMLFGLSYYVMAEHWYLGSLGGQFQGHFQEYLYYSMVSYTSLGLGDVYPHGALRLLTGIEGLTGLLMITWSAAFSFVHIEQLWLAREP
jgi:hypothetical protein